MCRSPLIRKGLVALRHSNGAYITNVQKTLSFSLERQTDIVFRQSPRSGRRGKEIAQLGLLHTGFETLALAEFVHELSHPPGEAHGLPYSCEAIARVRIDESAVAFLAGVDQRSRKNPHVRHCEIEAFSARRRHDMAGVAGEKQTAPTQRFCDKAAQRGDALFDRRSHR